MPVASNTGTTSRRGICRRSPLPFLPKPSPLRTLPDQIADSLRQAILRGRLRSGAHLVETRIAEQMRSSRGPVRDALRLLERDGLVARLPNRGTRVLDFSERIVWEAATLRAALEEFAVTLLVPRLEAEALNRLKTLVHRMEAAAHRHAGRVFNEADFQFHDTIVETCGHRTLHEVWRGMQRRIRAFLASSNWVSGDLDGVARHHQVIVRALASGRVGRVQRALRAHFVQLQRELSILVAENSGNTARATSGCATGNRRAPFSNGFTSKVQWR